MKKILILGSNGSLGSSLVRTLLNRKFNTPLQIVANLEKILQKKGVYKFSYNKINKWSLKNNYFFHSKKNYLIKTLKKYYI